MTEIIDVNHLIMIHPIHVGLEAVNTLGIMIITINHHTEVILVTIEDPIEISILIIPEVIKEEALILIEKT